MLHFYFLSAALKNMRDYKFTLNKNYRAPVPTNQL